MATRRPYHLSARQNEMSMRHDSGTIRRKAMDFNKNFLGTDGFEKSDDFALHWAAWSSIRLIHLSIPHSHPGNHLAELARAASTPIYYSRNYALL
eukprot:4906176-Amphidinium_carterae.1